MHLGHTEIAPMVLDEILQRFSQRKEEKGILQGDCASTLGACDTSTHIQLAIPMTYQDRAKDLYAMMEAGQLMEAFEKYYHEDVVVVEPTGEKREGKAAQRRANEEWLAAVEEMHDGGAEWVTSNEEEAVTMVQSFTDVTMRGKRTPFREIAVQEWTGDQIVHEEFFYFVPAEVQEAMGAT